MFPPRPNPLASGKRPAPKRLNYEARIYLGAIAVALPALVAFAIALVQLEARAVLWWTLFVPLLLLTIGLAARLRNRVVFPLYTLSNLLEALREGDFSLRGTRARRGDAIGEVIWEVNALGQTLREQRLKVEETLALLTKVLNTIDIAIFAFDAGRRLRLINPTGARLLAIEQPRAIGHTADDLGLSDCIAVDGAATLKRAFASGAGSYECRRATFREGGLPHDLLVITDLSRALREEERQAWQRLIRVLGHELNNSLAPIKSMADTLAELIGRQAPPPDWREDAAAGLGLIGERADALTRFMLGYTTLARLPPPSKREIDCAELVRRVSRLEARVPVQVAEGPALRVQADPDQLEQALINLTRNAAEASLPAGSAVTLRWQQRDGDALIEVEDRGRGLASTENLFVPFFTTKPGGSGIGLVLARQIVEAHGGSLRLANRPGGGVVASIRLPS